MALTDKIKRIADAIRDRNGTSEPMTLVEMAEAIESMEVGTDDVSTYILVDENGYEVPAVLVDEPVTLTATPNDIRIGTTAVTEEGVTVGEKEIPGYVTTQGKLGVKPNNPLKIRLFSDAYQYSKLMILVCEYNTSLNNSFTTVMVVHNDSVYNVGSATSIAKVTVDDKTQSIDLGLINDGDETLVLHYMTIKEEY